VKAEYIRMMGPDLGLLYFELEEDAEWLRHKWREFQELFGGGPKRIELLNIVAPNFFYFLMKLLFEDTMLHLSRLTDPPKSAGKETLTVMRLAELIHDPGFKTLVQDQAAQTKKSSEFARQWRNERLAHTDLLSLRKGMASTLPTVNTTKIDDAVKSIRDLLNVVGKQYSVLPSVTISDPWGAKSLVYYLEKAVRTIGAPDLPERF
jgi:hypothetical protein